MTGLAGLGRRGSAGIAVALVLTGLAAAALNAAPAAGAPADTSRILSVGGDVTEILYELGLGPRIVAVDTTSKHPPEAMKEKASVGYMRALSTEGVLSTNPSVIIASEGAGPPDVVAALKASSVPWIGIPDDKRPEAVTEKVRRIAEAMAEPAKGQDLARRIEAEFAALAADRGKAVTAPPRVLIVLSVQNGRAVVGGRDSSADMMLRLAGAENAASAIDGFKPVADEAAVGLKADVIVLLSRAGGDGGRKELLDLNWVRATPAGAKGRIIEMDAAYLLNFGPRSPRAARDLMTAIGAQRARKSADASR